MNDMVTTTLEKAKGALAACRAMDVEPGTEHPPLAYLDLLSITKVLAEVAQAEALDRIAHVLEGFADGAVASGRNWRGPQ